MPAVMCGLFNLGKRRTRRLATPLGPVPLSCAVPSLETDDKSVCVGLAGEGEGE